MKQLIIILSWTLLSCFSTYSQDIHSSHIFNTNILTTPGKTGMIYGNQRGILSYRDQWSTAQSPFKTYFMAVDAVIGKEQTASLGLGVYALRDNAGDLNLGNTQAMASISVIIPTGLRSKLSLALQGGYSQQSINSNGMKWDQQYFNGEYNEALPSGETANFAPFGYVDFNTGLNYYYNSKNRYNNGLRGSFYKEIEFGLAVHHLLRPKFQHIAYGGDRLYRKYVGHFNGVFNIGYSNYAFNPALIYTRQGPYQEISAGLMMRYTLKEASKHTSFSRDMNLSVGGFYRWLDAFVPSVFFEYHKYAIGMTFGLNHSKIRTATNYFAGYEIVLRFINF